MELRGQARRSATVVVWDRGVRLFHWLLVAAVAGAAWTGLFGAKSTHDMHLVLGATIVVLIVHRLVWGFLGSTYARFANFVPTPASLIGHARALLSGSAPAEMGHNPLGATMIFALLAALAGLAVTGLVVLGGEFKDGPLAPVTTFATGRSLRWVHEWLAYGLLALVVLHVGGVAIESLRTRENLVGAMLHGRKTARASEHGAPLRSARPWFAFGVTTLLMAVAAGATAYHSLRPGLGVPVAALDGLYAKECASCHSLHHPSLAPAATWAGIMSGLEDHFGDNAGLAIDATQTISAYLAANSAEHWDTMAANVLRQGAAGDPLRITATSGWIGLHRHVPVQAFKTKPVTGKLNCSQCHSDAETGRFLPRRITLPWQANDPRSKQEKSP